MKQFFALDEGEVILGKSLTDGMLYHLYCYAVERVLHEDHLNALAIVKMYTETEENVLAAYRTQNLEHEAWASTLWVYFHERFSEKKHHNADKPKNEFDDIISDSEVPF